MTVVFFIGYHRTPYYSPYSTGSGLQSSKVVDATGAGNAFLGAYAIGYLKTGDIKEAAYYGSVAASLALEKIGVPRKDVTDGHEKWNEIDVYRRLKVYMEQVSTATDTQ
jgi:bifunctional ADP-heptose synthase (sugar kinase/adenylyltransferase)